MPEPTARARSSWLWAERGAWTLGLVCVVAWAALSFQRAAGARQELARFADLQTGAVAQVAAPDVSDWDAERIAEWRASLEQAAPPPLAVLRIPKIKLEVVVLPGTDEFVLNRGVGHIPGTSLPGTDGNSAIAGHRDGFFRGLKDVVAGDAIEIETLGAREVYLIERMWVVDPEDVYVLEPTPVRSITLVTCYPFYYAGSAPHRYIVRAALAAGGVAPTAESRTPERSLRALLATQAVLWQSHVPTGAWGLTNVGF